MSTLVKVPKKPSTSEILLEDDTISKGKAVLIGNAIDAVTENVTQSLINKTIFFYEENIDELSNMTLVERKELLKGFVVKLAA